MFNQADEAFNLRLGHVRAVLSFVLYNEKQRADLQENWFQSSDTKTLFYTAIRTKIHGNNWKCTDRVIERENWILKLKIVFLLGFNIIGIDRRTMEPRPGGGGASTATRSHTLRDVGYNVSYQR